MRVPTIEELYGVPPGGFPSLLDEVEVIDVDAPRDTSKDVAITHELFVKLNRDALGIPGDGALVILSDSDEENPDVPAASPSPRLPGFLGPISRCFFFWVFFFWSFFIGGHFSIVLR